MDLTFEEAARFLAVTILSALVVYGLVFIVLEFTTYSLRASFLKKSSVRSLVTDFKERFNAGDVIALKVADWQPQSQHAVSHYTIYAIIIDVEPYETQHRVLVNKLFLLKSSRYIELPLSSFTQCQIDNISQIKTLDI
jgi:hypothetical protein